MPEHGRAVATHRDRDHLDVFMRSPDGTLLHMWGANGVAAQYDNAIDIGGDLESDPVAVRRRPAGMDVLALGKNKKILHWSWAGPSGPWTGPAELPGLAATEPRAVADGETLYVFARSVDGPIRWWRRGVSGDWESRGLLDPAAENLAVSDPVAVWRAPGVIDVYHYSKPSVDDGLLVVDTVTLENGSPVRTHTLRVGVFAFDVRHPLAAFSWIANRQDVYVRTSDDRVVHWARGNLAIASEVDEMHWYGPELIGPPGARVTSDPVAVSRVAGAADIFVRDEDTHLHRWTWIGGDQRRWEDRGLIDTAFAFTSQPVAESRNPDTVELVLRTGPHQVDVWAMDVTQDWSRHEWKASAFLQDPPQDALSGGTDDDPVDFLLIRPDDHLLIGVRAPGHVVTDETVPRLSLPHGEVVLTFPPQHIAEQVSRPGQAPSDGAWASALSGPSRLAVTGVPDTPLTSDGILNGLDMAAINRDRDTSSVELPRGLIIAPEPAEGGGAVVIRHPATPVGQTASKGLWRTRVGTTGGDGGFAVVGIRAGRNDTFRVALSKADRVRISEESLSGTGPGVSEGAHATQLEFSALGGTASITGRWLGVEWDHRAVLGRDQVVRTALEGVLYPLGHRAVWVEMTRRSDDEDTAVLRKTNTLYVTEPVRRPTDGAPTQVRNAFPFAEVRIEAREYRDLDAPEWTTLLRPTQRTEVLERQRDALRSELDEIHRALFPSPSAVIRLTEVLAETDARAARYLELFMAAQRYQRMIDVLSEEGLADIDIGTFFTPSTGGAALRFPVRCRAANGDVHFTVPLIFVADLRLTDEIRTPFSTLTDARLPPLLQHAYVGDRGGVVDLPGVIVDLTPATTHAGRSTSQTTLQEVRRLNIAGIHMGTGYLPTLGVPGDGRESWAADIGVPTIRTLTGQDPTARVVFSAEYLGGHATDVPLAIRGQVVDPVAGVVRDLDVDFADIRDRAGGLAAPRLIVDQLSLAHGLTNADPDKLLGDTASLLGFALRDLVGHIATPPQLTTTLPDGGPATVTMLWDRVPLRTAARDAPPRGFLPLDGSTVTLTVVSSAVHNESSCAVTDFKLRMPPGDDEQSLIELTFAHAIYQQVNRQAPTLAVQITDFRFIGRLELLDALQRKLVGIKDFPVRVEPSKDKVVARYAMPIPDVTALSFAMTNLSFSAALTVPFAKDPVALEIGFASRDRPFTLTVLMFGGGGYAHVELTHDGLRRLEISLQFGAAIVMNFGVGHAEVHAFGGIRYELVADAPRLTGYIHIGGSLDVLGLVSVAIELRVELAYVAEKKQLVGRAKLVIDIDVTLFSDSFELDSGEWVISGAERHAIAATAPQRGSPTESLFDAAGDEDRAALEWRRYREAFA